MVLYRVEPDREWTAGSPDCLEWQGLDLGSQQGTEAGLLGTVCNKIECDFRCERFNNWWSTWAEHRFVGFQESLGWRE